MSPATRGKEKGGVVTKGGGTKNWEEEIEEKKTWYGWMERKGGGMWKRRDEKKHISAQKTQKPRDTYKLSRKGGEKRRERKKPLKSRGKIKASWVAGDRWRKWQGGGNKKRLVPGRKTEGGLKPTKV